MANTPKITADNVEEFNEITTKLKTLPDSVLCQIEKVEKGLVGLRCTIRHRYGITEPIVYVTNNVTQIKDMGDYIAIYLDGFLLVINGEMKNTKINYVFVNPK